MCVCDDCNSVLQAKKQYLYSKIWEFGGKWAQGVKISSWKCHIWNRRVRRPWFAYSLAMQLLWSYDDDKSLRVVYSWAPPLLSIFRRKKTVQCVLGQNLTVLGDKWGFKIKFKFYNPEKAHPSVTSPLYEPSRVKIHQPVWPVRESQKKRYK